ncbi:hypothetical protein [Streptomyces sp. CBMA156]|uniref:hypothetical protein n=1 Tax=Streptomyces sp. CBMA156 TaxID=1930280 RepID=UPI0016620EA9|nr:hypothetical protein [Streptomyces sp. CBMA156]MBD0670186.1 hypothetical protein [Streptomyces sp. CBMA156]
MSQRRSYPNSGDFNLDDLFRPEPGGPQGQPGQQQGHSAVPPVGQPSGQPEYLGEGGPALPTQAMPAQPAPWGAPQPGYGAPQPGYGAPQPDQAPETQYLPPYPGGDPQAGGHPAAQPQYGYPPAPAQPGYQQQPAPGYQAYPPAAQPQQAYPAQDYHQGYAPEQGQGYGQGADQGYDTTRAGGSGRGGSRSTKLVIGGVVAGCAAAGILVAVLMGGDEPGKDKTTTPVAAASTGATTPAKASASGSGAAVDPDVKAQAQPLSDLLGTASDSRSSVVSAVASVQKCDKLPESQQALTAAAGKRRELQGKLGQLKTDKLPGGQQLVEQLNAAWTASAQADDEYAAWAQDAQGSCDAKKQDNPHYKNAVQASGTATTAKKQASTLWNTIAAQSGLPNRSDGDL